MTHTKIPFDCPEPHAREYGAVISELNSSTDGLTADEAARRLAATGPNLLPAPPGPGLFRRFFKHFNDPLIYVLLAAAAVTALLRPLG